MRYIIISLLLCLSACSTTVPVTAKFPDAPESLFEKCPTLDTIDTESVSIIDITKSVTKNYTTYYECNTKLEGWVEWYKDQKKIFNKVSQ